MNPWLAFLLGGLLACVCIGSSCGYLFAVATQTKERTLALAAALLRGMTQGLEEHCLVFEVKGNTVLLPIAEIASAVERGQFASPDPVERRQEQETDLPPIPTELRH